MRKRAQACASVRKRAEACGSVRKRAEACGSVRKRAGEACGSVRKRAEVCGRTRAQACGSVRKRAEACEACGSVRKRAEACGSVRKRAGGIMRYCVDWLGNGFSVPFLFPAVPGTTPAKNRFCWPFLAATATRFGILGLVVIFGQRPVRASRRKVPGSFARPSPSSRTALPKPFPTCLSCMTLSHNSSLQALLISDHMTTHASRIS